MLAVLHQYHVLRLVQLISVVHPHVERLVDVYHGKENFYRYIKLFQRGYPEPNADAQLRPH